MKIAVVPNPTASKGLNGKVYRSCTTCAVGRELVMFGGENDNKLAKEYFILSLDDETWSALEVPEEVRRAWHCAVVVGDAMLALGGYNGEKNLGDTWRLNVRKREWAKMYPHGSDEAHSRALGEEFSGAVVVKMADTVYRFGGMNSEGLTNSLHWIEVNAEMEQHASWTLVVATGSHPEPRQQTSMLEYEGCLYLFGGATEFCALNDLHQFDPSTFSWSKIMTSGFPPPAQWDGIPFALEGFMVVVSRGESAGFAVFEFGTRHWHSLKSRPPLTDENNNLLSCVNDPLSYEINVKETPLQPISCATYLEKDGEMLITSWERAYSVFFPGMNSRRRDNVGREIWRDASAFCDVTFELDCGDEIAAHRCMCSRYPRLSFLGEAPILTITGVPPQVFRAFLYFVYTDEFDIGVLLSDAESPNSVALLLRLLETAERFGVQRLKTICESLLLSRIIEDNCCDILVASDRVHAKDLEEGAGRFLLSRLNGVARTKGFGILPQSLLSKAIEAHADRDKKLPAVHTRQNIPNENKKWLASSQPKLARS